MPYKSQHTVPCAHCRAAVEGSSECPGCGRVVCGSCAARPETCRRPRARVARLGRGARLRAVGPDGQVAAVSSWTRKLRLWDVAGRRYLARPYAGYWVRDAPRTVMLRDRTVVCGRGVTLCGCGDHPVIAEGERVELPCPGLDLRPLPRHVISLAAFDCRSDLLAVATHDQLVVFRRDGQRIERIGSVRIEGEPVCFLGAAGDRVVSLTRDGRTGRLRGYRCASSVFYPLPFYEWIGGEQPELRFRPIEAPPKEPAAALDEPRSSRAQLLGLEPPSAAMASDGRTAAVALAGSTVAVQDLERGRVALYGDHSDGLCHVALPAGGSLLVTGDNDNRIIVRERDGHEYSRWLTD